MLRVFRTAARTQPLRRRRFKPYGTRRYPGAVEFHSAKQA